MPYIRVDQETKTVVKRLQAFFRIAEGKELTEGNTIKELCKETAFEVIPPNGRGEIIRYPFTQFEVKHLSPKDLAKLLNEEKER